MIILFFGDIFGEPGRTALKKALPQLKKEHAPDFILANGENMTHGRGILPKMAEQCFDLGIDLLTSGNHVWDQKEALSYIDESSRILRPANFSSHPNFLTPGKGVTKIKKGDQTLGVVNLMGRVFMENNDCPFQVAEKEVGQLKADGCLHVLVDFHAEATSEKQAMAHFLDGKVSAVLGTHCHVPTADERVLPGGTAMITDVGMCGCFDSVIGVRKEDSIRRFLSRTPISYEPAKGPGGYCGVLLHLDPETGKALKIKRLTQLIA